MAVLALLVVAGCGETSLVHVSFAQSSACSAYRDVRSPPHTDIVAWHPDGSRVYFSTGAPGAAILAVNVDGPRRKQIVRTGPPGEASVGPATSFDLSPAGWHLVYATCAFRALTHDEREPPESYYYVPELGRVRADGSDSSRLTEDHQVNAFPAWSPDGRRIAFLSRRSHREGLHIHTMSVTGTEVRALDSGPVARQAPRWSPDGQSLAYLGIQDTGGRAIYTVGADGMDRQRLTVALSGPSWSPDGQRIAFAKLDSDGVALFTIAADGTDSQRVTTIRGWRPQSGEQGHRGSNPTPAWIEAVAWSPDGSKILYGCGGICVVTPSGTPVSKKPLPGTRAAWSPNGTRIATIETEFAGSRGIALYVAAPDGSDRRTLAARN